MTTLVALDTETTGLHPGRRVWDIGLIVRRPGHPDHERQWFVAAEDLDLGNADPFGLKICRYYELHPEYCGTRTLDEGRTGTLAREVDVLQWVESLTRGAHIVGAVPNFDTEVLDKRMRAHGILPSWHYHLQCAEILAAGFLRGRGERVEYPYKSDELAERIGVDPPGDEDRHTALGDARWALRMFDAVMGGPQP